MMHPIERLRFLARSGSLPPRPLVQEAAGALASFADEPQGFLTACQRVLARQPGCGPLVWLVARAVSALDPYDELWAAAAEVQDDPTPRLLADALPEGRVVAVGPTGSGDGELGAGLARRPDVAVLAIGSATGRGAATGSRLRPAWWEDDGDAPRSVARVLAEGGAETLDPSGLAPAVQAAAAVLVEARAIGPTHALVPLGGGAAAACGRAFGVPVWLVGGVGRQFGPRMWDGLSAPYRRADPWHGELEALPLTLVDQVAGPTGLVAVEVAHRVSPCPECPELYRGLVL